MKRKFWALVFSIGMLCSMVACGSNSVSSTNITIENSDETNVTETIVNSENTEDNYDEAAATIKEYAFGETASTDILDFTINDAALAIALYDAEGSNSFDDFLTPKEYDETADKNNPFVASIGETVVSLTFTVTNNNRTEMSFGYAGFSDDFSLDMTVDYNGSSYTLLGQDKRTETLLLSSCAEKVNGGDWNQIVGNSVTIESGDSILIKTLGFIETDVANLSDAFKIHVYIPNSKGELQEFVFAK